MATLVEAMESLDSTLIDELEQAKRHVSGTGMGLAIARGMLAAERGQILAANCPDGGAQFTIVIPADIKLAEAAEQTS